jgi:hypothetical protein
MSTETFNTTELGMSPEREAEIKTVFAQMALIGSSVFLKGDEGYEGTIILGED